MMKILSLTLAASLIAAAGFATTASAERRGSVGARFGVAPGSGSGPNAGVGIRRVPHRGLSPHIGLPGISGFPNGTKASPSVSPHIGLPGFSGFPLFSSDDRRRHHRNRHDDRFDDELVADYWGYDSDGYVDTIPMADQFGFFATGGEVTVERGKPVYHYDRSYPYDWYRGSSKAGGPRAESSLRCRVQPVWDEEQRVDVPVRVCSPA